MKVINPDPAYASYVRIFKEVQGLKQKVVVWQLTPQGQRTVCETLLISYNVEAKSLNLLPPAESLDAGLPLYFYIEASEVIFKSTITSLTQTSMTASFPNEMRALDESEESVNFKKNHVSTMWISKTSSGADRLSDTVRVKSMKERTSRDQEFLNTEFDMSLDEEDKLYADKRESPRVRPKADKLVKVVRKGEVKVHVMKLFDLSRGGMGFLTYTPEHFPKTAEIYVTGFDTFELDDPLIGTVMSHRPVDETNTEFKIGVKFNDGQE